MSLQADLNQTHHFATPEQWTTVQAHLPQQWIEQALQHAGIATLRKRRLPMEQVVWLVLGIALLRDRSILNVAEALDLALPADAAICSSALSQARQRLGSEPLQWLFQHTAAHWQQATGCHRWRSLGLYALDGVVWRTPDTAENRQAFGGQSNHEQHQSPFPQVRMACLLAVRERLLVDASLDAYACSEYTLAERLWPQLPSESLLLIDKGFYSANLLWTLQQHGRHWLIPARANARGEVLQTYATGDVRLRMTVSPQARKKNPALPAQWEVRAITRALPNGQSRTVFTSLADPEQWPADEVFALYHERWEIELAYGEIKTELQRQAMTLRSQRPEGIRQELWATLLMYNLIRLEMLRIAEEAAVPPCRISFLTALRFIVDEWLWSSSCCSPGTIPGKLKAMRGAIKRFILPPRRGERHYPRAVKMSKTRYPVKKHAAQA